MCNETKSDNIFSIPSWNVNRLEEEVKKLNKRAKKLGCDKIELTTHEVKHIVDPRYLDAVSEGNRLPLEEAPKVEIHVIEVIGKGPIIEGWKFIGTLDHSTIPGSVLVKSVPGETVPPQFFNSDPICEHCNTKRYRTETFVLENVESGEYKQVGRQCIKDFLGHNPTRIANYLTTIFRLIENLDDPDSDYYGGGGSGVWLFDSMSVLTTTIAIIRTYGWVSRAAAGYDLESTADAVIYAMSPTKSEKERENKKKFLENLRWDKEKDSKEAEEALDWLKEQSPTNDYFHNLHALAALDDIPASMFGYWCSLIATYQKAKERLILAQRQKKLNEWFGDVKNRYDLDVEVTKIRAYDSYYGTGNVITMLDKDGHTLVWFTNTEADVETGGKYKVKATVKKHDTYDNWKQTIVTRVKIIKELVNE